MANLSAPANRADEPRATRVVVVRDAPRSVRPIDEPSRFGANTLFWTAIAAGFIGLLWLTGHLGERLGFAAALGLPELVVSTDAGLSAGVRTLVALPRLVIAMAKAEPLYLVPAFVLVSIPAAALAVAKPRIRGGPPVTPLTLAWSRLGLVAACLVWVGLLAWLAWPTRLDSLSPLPLDRYDIGRWTRAVAAIAGADFFAWAASLLWLVLLFRMPLPRATIGLAAVLGFVASAATWVGFATSAGVDDGLRIPRPVATAARDEYLLVGSLAGKAVLLSGDPVPSLVAAEEPRLRLVEVRSLADWLKPPADVR